ncbi:hypothetical protein ACFSHQ_04440 [Gemmobacter lanyuensis]
MSGLAAQVRAHEMQDLARPLRRLQRMSDQLGLISLAQVAGICGSVLIGVTTRPLPQSGRGCCGWRNGPW